MGAIKPIPGHPHYGANADGMIFSLRGNHRPLTPQKGADGIYRVGFTEHGSRCMYRVGDLVMQAFGHVIPPEQFAWSKDGDESNMSLDNLFIGTRQEQVLVVTGREIDEVREGSCIVTMLKDSLRYFRDPLYVDRTLSMWLFPQGMPRCDRCKGNAWTFSAQPTRRRPRLIKCNGCGRWMFRRICVPYYKSQQPLSIWCAVWKLIRTIPKYRGINTDVAKACDITGQQAFRITAAIKLWEDDPILPEGGLE